MYSYCRRYEDEWNTLIIEGCQLRFTLERTIFSASIRTKVEACYAITFNDSNTRVRWKMVKLRMGKREFQLYFVIIIVIMKCQSKRKLLPTLKYVRFEYTRKMERHVGRPFSFFDFSLLLLSLLIYSFLIFRVFNRNFELQRTTENRKTNSKGSAFLRGDFFSPSLQKKNEYSRAKGFPDTLILQERAPYWRTKGIIK